MPINAGLHPASTVNQISSAMGIPLRLRSAGKRSNPSRTRKPAIDWRLYKERHQIECFFNKLKRFRRIAMRCEKTISAFMGFVHLACAMI
ncbi:transposase [Sphingomonas sp. SORGH_AS 950]|nr:transposase [Sphingomonas sp. SORGH_AS_0950]